MIVREINLYHVQMPMLEPWVTAYGSQDMIESLFVNLKFDEAQGWGECAPAPLPLYNTEYTKGAFHVAHDVLAPRLIGRTISSPDNIAGLFEGLKGHEFTKSAFETAVWDAYAKTLEEPLWSLIGGTNPSIMVGADIPVLASTDALIDRIAEAIDQGFPRVKLKFNRQCTPDMIEKVRNTYPDLVMHIDCNSGFTLDDMDMFQRLDHFNLKMIEQPLAYDDLIDHAELQKALQTPICLDESITSAQRAAKAIQIKACQWINIKTSRVGGLTNAIAIHDLCQQNDVPVWVGGMLESAVGQAPSMALATKDNVGYPCDIFPSSRFFEDDFSAPDITLSQNGRITAPDRPGCGFSPKMDKLHKHSVATARIA
ncbi:MAG: o-succinylbenzoate synthase [Candidatus Puniceispirillum sp. TMED52]|nr:o-succinylbenzoate synthase [SAR116 cluster bacterium]OUU49307.1 MAG: o-succinylbenzoate synthase [Candidatus Puniceispirillum sp. TMED52]HCP19229.1 o-succinylbenzoate synthase [Alphaproteobacteria bacterium]|tara:strand:+ start:1341 stop:2447 length:1107 start_codon:yes stop_codon:yes gene_type:complete